MDRHREDGTERVPNMLERLRANRQSMADALLSRPVARMPERNGGAYRIASAVPAYLPEAQVTQANGRTVSPTALAPLVGKRYRMKLQRRIAPGSPTYLETDPPRGPGVSQNPY